MKANRVPAIDRIRIRISALHAKLDSIWRPYGKGNPYDYCTHCEQSMPYVSIEGHRKRCPVKGWEGELRYFERLLAEQLKEAKKEGT